MTAKFLSSGLSPSRITQGQSPPTRRGAGPSFLPAHPSPAPQALPYGQPGVMRLRAPRFRPKPPSGRGGPEGASRNRHERFPMNATEIAACVKHTGRRRLPPLPSPRPQTGQILDSWRHKRRQGALALRAPGASRHTRKMDRRRDQRTWRSARSHPSAHRRSIAAARHG